MPAAFRKFGFQMKPKSPPIDVPGSTLFQKMDNLFRAVIAVPRTEIDRREQQWKQEHGKPRKKNRREKSTLQSVPQNRSA